MIESDGSNSVFSRKEFISGNFKRAMLYDKMGEKRFVILCDDVEETITHLSANRNGILLEGKVVPWDSPFLQWDTLCLYRVFLVDFYDFEYYL